MAVADGCPLAIGFLFVLLVMPVVAVDQILELAKLTLQMDGFDFGVIQLGIYGVSFPGRAGGDDEAHL